jgi:hypothetical protein
MALVRQVNRRGSTWQSSTGSTFDMCLCHRSTCRVRTRAHGAGTTPDRETHFILFFHNLSVDPLEALGRSIGSAVLERLDVYSLIRAGQVCRYSVSILGESHSAWLIMFQRVWCHVCRGATERGGN